MEIHKELNQIASADYGLQLKDPIFAAYSKLVTDPKFELVQNTLVDDYAEFEEALRKFNINITLNKTIRNFLDLLVILNGRKGFLAKSGSAHPQGDATYNIAYWIDMLGKELINSGTGVYTDGVDERGSGVVNGSRMRAAMYHILDILQYKYSEFRDYQIITFESPCCIIGRDMYNISIWATTEDIGYLNPDDNKYYVDIKVKNLWRFKDEQTITIEIGDEPLHKDSHISKDCRLSMPFSLYSISIDGFEGELTLSYYQIREEEITPGAIKVKTGVLPLTFYTVDTSLLDWYLRGSVNGVGKLGKNLLKQREITVPNGAAGTFLDSVFHAWIDPFEGRTFNSGEATRIYFTIRRSDDSNLDAANVGDFMLVEGTTIPTVYDADTNLYKKPILQGSSVYHTSEVETGVSQVIYTNEDEYGRTVMYGQDSGATAMRCKTYSIKLKPNTDYSVRIFNSSYSNLQIGGTFMTEPGTVEQYFANGNTMGGGIVNLPSCEPFDASNEQWSCLSTSHSVSGSNTQYPIDVRPYKFEFCESVADLDAGTYKLMIDILGNHHMVHGATTRMVGFAPYLGCYLDVEWDYAGRPVPPSNKFEHFALIGEDDSLIIPETQVFNSSTVRYKDVGDTPYPNFFHQEYTFTVPRKMKVGVLHRAYTRWNYYGGDGDESPWFRFMIFKNTVEPTEFETTGLTYNISGQSAWEPYKYTLPITISNVPESPDEPALEKRVDIDLGDKPLGPNDTIHMTDVDLPIPTFEGWNVIDCLSDTLDKPYAYIRYQQ